MESIISSSRPVHWKASVRTSPLLPLVAWSATKSAGSWLKKISPVLAALCTRVYIYIHTYIHIWVYIVCIYMYIIRYTFKIYIYTYTVSCYIILGDLLKSILTHLRSCPWHISGPEGSLGRVLPSQHAKTPLLYIAAWWDHRAPNGWPTAFPSENIRKTWHLRIPTSIYSNIYIFIIDVCISIDTNYTAHLRWLGRRARQTSPRTSRVLNVRSTVFPKEEHGEFFFCAGKKTQQHNSFRTTRSHHFWWFDQLFLMVNFP